MSKFNTGKASILVLTAVLAFAAFLLGRSITSILACEDGWGKCVSTGPQCGTDNGTQSKTESRGYDWNCPEGYQNNPDHGRDAKDCRKVETQGHYGNCPNGYSIHDSDKCKKNTSPHNVINRPWVDTTYSYSDKVKTYKNCERDWSIDPNDESKCIKTQDCHTGVIDNRACPTPVNCNGDWDYTGVCSKSCGGGQSQQVFDISTPASNGGTACTNNQGDLRWTGPSCNTQSCITDICANLDGIQETLPDGMQVNDDHVCSCENGYHEVNADRQIVEFDHLDNFTCEPDASPSPSPEATPTPSTGGGGAGAPVCNAAKPGTPTILSAIRSGSKETLTWSSVANATYYSIVYGSTPGYQYGVANTGNVTSYTINGLNPGVTYHFAVNAVNDCMPGDLGIQAGTGTGGQVLGASTMAGTGSFDGMFYQAIMSIGAALSAFGLKGLKKAQKVSKK